MPNDTAIRRTRGTDKSRRLVAAAAGEKADSTMPLSDKASTSRPLEALGVSEMEEQVYRVLLKRRLASAKDIAGTLALPSRQIRQLLDALIGQGLVSATPERKPRYIASSPELAIEALVSRRLADVERARAEIERTRLAITELKDCAGHAKGREHEQIVELITDQALLRQAVVHMQQMAEREFMGFQIAPVLFSMAYQPHLKKSVRARTISDSDFTVLPGSLESIRMAMRAGEETRVCSSLPVKMLVVDRRIGLIPLNSGDPNSPSLLVRRCALLDALCALFEWYWEHATPISISQTGELHANDATAGLSKGPQDLIPLLTAGLNDKAIALEAGISEATLTRRIAELMKHYDTRTRFQLGWRTALEAFPNGLAKARKAAG